MLLPPVALLLSMAGAARGSAQSVPTFEVVVYGAPETMLPNSNPLFRHTPDGAISYRVIDGRVSMWFSASSMLTTPWTPGTMLLQGPTLDALGPVAGIPGSRVLAPSGSGFDQGYAGANSVLPAANGRDLLMFYHGENHDCGAARFKAGVGLARSADGGVTWQRQGQVISTAAPSPTDCTFPIWGVGNPSVFRSRDGQYLYMLFMEWLHGDPVSRPDVMYLARAPIGSDGMPGAWQKYANGTFSQPGLGGLGTPVIGQPPPGGAATVYAGLPSVSYNVALGQYLVIFQSLQGLYVAASPDGITWSSPRLIYPAADIARGAEQNGPWIAYPSLLSPDQPSQETTSATGYLYYAQGVGNNNPPHVMTRRRFAVGVGPLAIRTSVASREHSMTLGDPAPTRTDSVEVSLSGYGISSASWSAATTNSWIRVTSGAASEPTAWLRWTRDASRLGLGTHVATITVTMSGGAVAQVVDTLRVVEPPVAIDCAADELLGAGACLTDVQRRFLDLTGNNDQTFNLGDLINYLDRKHLALSALVLDRLIASPAAARGVPLGPSRLPSPRRHP